MFLLLNRLLNGFKKIWNLHNFGDILKTYLYIIMECNIYLSHIFLQLTNGIFLMYPRKLQNSQSPNSLLKVHINSLFCECTHICFFMKIFPWLRLYCTNPFHDLVVLWVFFLRFQEEENRCYGKWCTSSFAQLEHQLYNSSCKEKENPHYTKGMVCQQKVGFLQVKQNVLSMSQVLQLLLLDLLIRCSIAYNNSNVAPIFWRS